MMYIYLFFQSVFLAMQELWNNKLRSMLSLAGITVGILCIISVLTAVDSLERNIRDTIQSFGNDLVFIEKWPWDFGGEEYPWWKYINRPSVSIHELEFLQERSRLAKAIAFQSFLANVLLESDKGNSIRGVTAMGITNDFNIVKDLQLEDGRYFTDVEFHTGQSVAIIGNTVATSLFGSEKNLIGKEMRMKGRKVKVVGVLKKEGKDLFNSSNDDQIIVPATFLSYFINENNVMNSRRMLLVKPKPGVDLEEQKAELAGLLRQYRRIRPDDDENFALNNISMVTAIFDSLFITLNMAGWAIGFLSILVGGFGIANIMFVSVRERTSIIGVKKALGARSFYILTEFIVESVCLCLIGGLIGLGLVWMIFELLDFAIKQSDSLKFEFYLSTKNILVGIGISVVTGVVFGFIPALTAARLHPVEAMRSHG